MWEDSQQRLWLAELIEEVAVKNNFRAVDVWGGKQSGVIDSEAQVMGGFSEGFRTQMIMSDLSQFSLTKLAFIHDLISVRQLAKVK